MSDANNALAGANATVPDAIEMRSLSLIGVMQAQDGPAALLRSARGQIARVTVGAEVFGVQITAIGEEEVIYTNRWGQSETLSIPGQS